MREAARRGALAPGQASERVDTASVSRHAATGEPISGVTADFAGELWRQNRKTLLDRLLA